MNVVQRFTDAIPGVVGLELGDLVTLGAFAIAGLIAAAIVSFAARRSAATGRVSLPGSIHARSRRALYCLLPVIGVGLAVPGIDTGDGLAAYLPRSIAVVSIGLTGWFAVGIVNGFVDHVMATHSIQHADNLEDRRIQTQIRVFGRVIVFAIVVASVAGILVSIPSIRNIGVSLFASAGIAGLAVGLAARPALGNLIAGIQIALTQPIRLEDAVLVEGEWGWVEEITMTFVVVRIWDLRRLVLPISYFIEKPFQNWTRTRADILGSVMIHVDYAVPLEAVRAEFGRALRESDHWDGKVEVVHVTDCTERTMQLRLLMSARSSPDAWELRCAVRERIITFLQERYPESLPRLRLEQAGDQAGR